MATVSYVFNGSSKVSKETRDLVLRVADELGYIPSQVARSLSTRRTMQLSIMINDIANPVYAALISGFEDEAVQAGYLVNVCNGRDHADRYFESIITRGIDGVLVEVMPYKFHIEKLQALIAAETNIVLFGNYGIDTQHVACFEIDYPLGMALAIDHLAALGHRKIIYLSGLSAQDLYDSRISGFLKAIGTTFGMPAAVKTISTGKISAGGAECIVLEPGMSLSTSLKDGEYMARALLSSGLPFTAVVCTNDLMAIGAMSVFRRFGLSIPKDVSVVGIDNTPFSAIVTPPLTSIAPDYTFIGVEAFRLLRDVIEKRRFGYFKFAPSLILRDSTGPVVEI